MPKLAHTGGTLTDYNETLQSLSSTSAIAIDLASGNVGTITLSEDVTDIDFTNVPTGLATFQLYITQDSTDRTVAINQITVNGGAHAVGLTSGNGGYTMTTGSGKVDIVTFAFVNQGTPHITFLQDMRNS